MDRSEGNDDELYPSAPLPAHERQWRHPSEMGEQAWVTSEPPLTIGRGLTAATGAVGGILALAVLWTMLPTHAGRGAGVSVRSTVASTAGLVSSTSAALVDPSTTGRPATTTTAPTTTQAPETTQASTGSSVDPVEPHPVPTYAVQHHIAVGDPASPGAVAVAVNDGSLVITTAGAVELGDVVDLRLPDGGLEQAHVLLVDQRSGLAVLAHDTPAVEPFTVAASVAPGDILSFYGVPDVTAVVKADGTVDTSSLTTAGTDTPLAEGTPVVNQRGELVALCSHGDNGPDLVSLSGLDQLRRELATAATGKVWVGIMLGNDSTAGLVVDTLDPAGPAADAGMRPGDVITTVDAVAVADPVTLGTVLASHQPGDTVVFDVVRAGATVSVAVVLGLPRASL